MALPRSIAPSVGAFFLLLYSACPLMAAPASTSSTTCVPIKTIADIDKIRQNLSGHFCLTRDIDLKPFTKFTPIDVFSGVLDGRGHVMRNLTIGGFGNGDSGLFLSFHGTVKNLGLINAHISSCLGSAGALAATTSAGAVISHVYSTGFVQRNCELVNQPTQAGGLIGEFVGATADHVYSTVAVSGPYSSVGGLFGRMFGGSSVTDSYAAGSLVLGGGLIGWADGTVTNSFAMGPVNGGGGLVEVGATNIGASYAVGRVASGGGLVVANSGVVTHSYWDVQTTGQSTSANGTPETTVQLQKRLPSGFSSTHWAITSQITYPYLDLANFNFMAPLAVITKTPKIYLFLPIGQFDATEYSSALAMGQSHQASLAAVYTMIGRALGVTDGVDELDNVAIDTYFWSGKRAFWRGPATQHASLSVVTQISSGQALDDSNVIGAIKAREAVIIHGTYTASGKTHQHWMLATSFTTDSVGQVAALVANDPWTGSQVQIDPVTKTVVHPADFPLADFIVDDFTAVTLN